ncbi:MutS-related protein [Pseudozobellia thermophila]|uniref:MutS domain V n=1 Tax=Pseudozobellia thermophila TaxID=192903 RepID=A0A1M6MZX7_9FLAO|nr:DNA mismatch repair protein MutS [Pseudozobellia thermophila]SHJ88968.1 MutS domain V [Pseudozobellia thermophila]
MQELISFYTAEIERYESELSVAKKRLYASSMLRLLVFCGAIGGLYLAYPQGKWMLALLLPAIALFLFLVTRHSRLQYRRDLLTALIDINTTELRVLRRDFHDLPDGSEFKDPLHYYSQDIDLFGRGSFYQYANRTALKQGSEIFARLLTENGIDGIELKQEAIKELAQNPEWRQRFSAIASLAKTGATTQGISDWLKGYQRFVPGVMKVIPYVFSALTLCWLVLYFMDVVPEALLITWWVVGMGITGAYLKKTMFLMEHTANAQSVFQQYHKLMVLIEDQEFEARMLQNEKTNITSEKFKVSEVTERFSKLLYNLDKVGNLVYSIFANGFFLRTVSHCYQVEDWIGKYGTYTEKWFDTVAFFDAYNSLGNFAFNHPSYSFPKIANGDRVLESIGTGHPLLDPEQSVLNDFTIDKQQFFIVTGANMAGKSTFLRTVSLEIVMANLGLPVCAKEVRYSPIKLITSMRTTDSLTDDESYFFSELKRLKFIVDEIQKDRYFIVLDEILKGTNSIDKAKGSRKFVERLVRSRSTGIIATHDLSLCEVADELPQVENHYFDAEIIDNELHFDYKFKDGVCKNMNASFLLRKMEIVD